jgi:hypothetical protein
VVLFEMLAGRTPFAAAGAGATSASAKTASVAISK